MGGRQMPRNQTGLLFSFIIAWLVFEGVLIATPASAPLAIVKIAGFGALIVFAVYGLWRNRTIISSVYARIRRRRSGGQSIDSVALSLWLLTLFCSGFIAFQARNTELVFLDSQEAPPAVQYAILILPFSSQVTDEQESILIKGLYSDFVEEISGRLAVRIIAPAAINWDVDSEDNCMKSRAAFNATHVFQADVIINDGIFELDTNLSDCVAPKAPHRERLTAAATPIGVAEAKNNIILALNEYVSPASSVLDGMNAGGESGEAFQLYLESLGMNRGSRLFTAPFARKEIIGLLETAVALDPELDVAWARLALAYSEQAWYELEETGYAQSDQIIELLKARLGKEHFLVARAEGLSNLYKRRIPEAEQGLRRAIEVRPGDMLTNFSMGQLLFLKSELEEAVPYFERTLEVDPYFTLAASRLIGINLQLARFEEFKAAAEALGQMFGDGPLYKSSIIFLYNVQVASDQQIARSFFTKNNLLHNYEALYFPWHLTAEDGAAYSFYEQMIEGAKNKMNSAEASDSYKTNLASTVRHLLLSYAYYLDDLGDNDKRDAILADFHATPLDDALMLRHSRSGPLLQIQMLSALVLIGDLEEVHRQQIIDLEKLADEKKDRNTAASIYVGLATLYVIERDKEAVYRLIKKAQKARGLVNPVTVLSRMSNFDAFMDDPRFQELVAENEPFRGRAEEIFKGLLKEDYIPPRSRE